MALLFSENNFSASFYSTLPLVGYVSWEPHLNQLFNIVILDVSLSKSEGVTLRRLKTTFIASASEKVSLDFPFISPQDRSKQRKVFPIRNNCKCCQFLLKCKQYEFNSYRSPYVIRLSMVTFRRNCQTEKATS